MTARLVMFFVVVVFAAASWVFSCEADRLQSLTERVAILEPRNFEQLTVLTAGTGAAQEDPERLGPLIVIGAGNRVVLVDAGRAPAEALRKAMIPLAQPDTLLLTSLLPENVAGLGELLVTGWTALRERPLRVVGPAGTKSVVEGIANAYAGSVGPAGTALGQPVAGSQVEAIEVGDVWSEERDGFTVKAVALPGNPIPALAYRFERGGRSVAISGVGYGADAVVDLAKDVDILLHGAMYTPTVEAVIEAGGPDGERMKTEAAWHAAAAAVGEVATRASAHKLVLIRLRPPPLHDRQYTGLVRETYVGPILVAEDGDELTR